jgi:hypothetical protein
MNGVIEARLAPRDEAERRKAVDAGHVAIQDSRGLIGSSLVGVVVGVSA